MSHYAQVINGVVEQVIVAEQEFINTLPDAVNWIQTSYNTHQGQHSMGGTPLRKNFAGIGFSYSAELDAFIPPKPYASWILNTDTCQWQPPFPPPQDDLMWAWNEQLLEWQEWILE
jgi:hypothetical protein